MAMSKKEALRKWNADNPKDVIEFKEGKGRLSGAANAKLNDLVVNGWDILGMSITHSTDTAAPVVKTEKAGTSKEIVELLPYRYDEEAWKAISKVPVFGTKTFGMREVCHNSGFSLVGCYSCPDNDSHIVLGVPVQIVPV